MCHVKGWTLPVTEEGASEVAETLKVRGRAAIRMCVCVCLCAYVYVCV